MQKGKHLFPPISEAFDDQIMWITIWVEDAAAFGQSWDLLISEDADMLYPAHGKPFAKEELVRFRQAVDRIRLYALE